jgi:hypothetical protein
VDDPTNGLCLCLQCHDGFDADMVCINPLDNTLHVAECLKQSVYFSGHFAPIAGQAVVPASTKWPSLALFEHRFTRCQTATAQRHMMLVTNPFCCQQCHYRCVSKSGLSRHQGSKRCIELEGKKHLIGFQFTPVKAASAEASEY